MKKRLTTIIVILTVITGLSLLLYPSLSDLINSFNHRHVISEYISQVESLDEETYHRLLSEAKKYNETLLDRPSSLLYLSDKEREVYESLLDITGTGVMGYIEIPSVNISLPIYHGTDDSVLQIGVGHMEGSSLPVGGESVHTILSGHRGLPSARLFTSIDELAEGDTFTIRVLNEKLTYEVDQIQTVEPTELESLRIESGKDYCTLVTCTPYGINTHRLLVRGHRIESQNDSNISNQTEAKIISFWMVALIAAILVIFASAIIILLCYLISKHKRKQ